MEPWGRQGSQAGAFVQFLATFEFDLKGRSARVSGEDQWHPPEGSWASSAAARKRMVSTRSRDTTPELAIRSAVHRRGLRYRVDYRPVEDLRRRADLVFRKAKVAAFVDGCYWHGCPDHWAAPKSNTSYWREKIEGNRARDRDTDQRLRNAGWTVLRIWEHEDPEDAADRIERTVKRERSN